MRFDLHVHANERSVCATDDEQSQIRAAQAAGLDGLAFTDHHRLVPEARLAELRKKYTPFRIFSGIEITADQEDWLVLGLHDTRLERENWDYPSLWRFVREQGGYIVLAHPFRWSPIIHVDLDQYPPDAIELRSNNTPVSRADDIRRLAEWHGLSMLCNSDGHSNRMIGAYWNDVPGEPQDDRSLLNALREMALLQQIATPAD